MILRAWSGSLVDTAEYRWTIWPRWAIGWLRFAWANDPPRCRARHESGLRCWERRGHRRPHQHDLRGVYITRVSQDGSRVASLKEERYRWTEVRL